MSRSAHSRFSSLKKRRRAERRKHKRCFLCGSPISKGMEVSYQHNVYHSKCAVKAAKEKKDGQQIDGSRRSAESDAGGAFELTNSFVN